MQSKNLSSFNQRFSNKLHKGNKRLDNRGASLVMVLMVMALIFVLVSIILMLTVTNLFMKDAGEKNTKNFYDAESSMDEIKAGLAEVCGKAYQYAKTQSQGVETVYREEKYKSEYVNYIYRTLADPSTHEKQISAPDKAVQRQYYKEKFRTNTAGIISVTDTRSTVGGFAASTYDTSYNGLAACLKGTSQAAINKTDKSGNPLGGEVLNTDAGDSGKNYINIYPKTGEVVLKNVAVQYRDEHDYVTKIKTDIRLVCPDANIGETTTINNILYYTLITDDSIQLSHGTDSGNVIQGNMFAGYNNSNLDNFNVSMTPGGTTTAGQICYFISGGNIKLNNTSSLDISRAQMWVKGITLGGKDASGGDDTTSNTFNLDVGSGQADETRLYMQDDLNLYQNSNLTLAGQLFGFGNPEDLQASSSSSTTVSGSQAVANGKFLPSMAVDAHNVRKTISADISEKPYEYSSAILVNGKSSKLNLKNLDSMSLAGNAYVNANPSKTNSSNKDIKTGESISIKPSQRAYLFPAGNLVTGANPVSGNVFAQNSTEIQTIVTNAHYINKYPYTSGGVPLPVKMNSDTGLPVENADGTYAIDQTQINVTDPKLFITGQAADGSTPADWKQCIASGYDKTFADLGVDDIRIAAFQTHGGSPVIYFFMKFTTDQKANDFFNTYYNNITNYNTLVDRFHMFASGSANSSEGLELPDNIDDTSKFYFNGNLVASNKSSVTVPDTFTTLGAGTTAATDKEAEELENTGALYDTYFSLLTNLKTRYSDLSEDEMTKTIFDNLINQATLTEAFSTSVLPGINGYGHEDKRYFVTDTGKGAILCHKPKNADGSLQDVSIDADDIAILQAIYDRNYNGGSPSSDSVQLALIVADTNVTIGSGISSYSGLILAKGKITIAHNIKILQDPSSVIVAMNAAHIVEGSGTAENEGYKIKMPREVFRFPGAFSVGGMNVTGTTGQAASVNTTLTSLVQYDNWVRE